MGTLLSSTSGMEIGVEPAHREANINQLCDLVSQYPQEYRASASTVIAHREWTDCS